MGGHPCKSDPLDVYVPIQPRAFTASLLRWSPTASSERNWTPADSYCSECESAIKRLFTDRRHFARPARTLFANVRPFFAISDLSRVFAAIEHNMAVAQRFIDETPEMVISEVPRECHATTRKGTNCRRQPLHGSEYCPSHQHLTETFDELHLEQGELELLEVRADGPRRLGGVPSRAGRTGRARRTHRPGGSQGPPGVGFS